MGGRMEQHTDSDREHIQFEELSLYYNNNRQHAMTRATSRGKRTSVSS